MDDVTIGYKHFSGLRLIGATQEGEAETLARKPGLAANQLFELLVRRAEARPALSKRALYARECMLTHLEALSYNVWSQEAVWIFYATSMEEMSNNAETLIRIGFEEGGVGKEDIWREWDRQLDHDSPGEPDLPSMRVMEWRTATVDFHGRNLFCAPFLFKDLRVGEDEVRLWHLLGLPRPFYEE